MRASEVLGCGVVDSAGLDIGVVRDLRVGIAAGPPMKGFAITGLVVSGRSLRAAAAVRWGFAEGRARGPWLIERFLAAGVRDLKFIPIDRIESWGPGQVKVAGHAGDLQRFEEAIDR